LHFDFADYICSTLLTMNHYFIKLLQYDKQANLQINDLIFAANQPANAVKLMAHLLMAQQVWLSRCKGLPAPAGSIWPDWQAVQFKYLIEENSQAWIEYLQSLTDNDFNRTINYRNSKGDEFNDKLTDILAHLINHGTHHRAQIGQCLKLAGVEQLPITDYIFYVRQQTQQ
jgi:uncharacterized damage-inducible protein DinB